MLRIVLPNSYISERTYILNVILKCFWDFDYEIECDAGIKSTFIYCENGCVEIPDVFLGGSEGKWLTKESLPHVPLDVIDISFDGLDIKQIPVIFGRTNDDGQYIKMEDRKAYLGVDIFGSAFFMLTRYEEIVIKKRDGYDRFPVEESLAYKENFLTRPIINEYTEILWKLLKHVSPDIQRKEKIYRVIPTHDIDKPFGMVYDSPVQILRHFASDLIVTKSLKQVCKRFRDLLRMVFAKDCYIKEKKETFKFILQQSSKYNLKDVFFFMNTKASWRDGNYTVDEPDVLDLIKELVCAGHFVGLHPSFDSYDDKDEICCETMEINRILKEAGCQGIVGARQHYLKWKNPDTWQFYADAGISFDSTMTYAGHVGFRTGICYPYPVFNLMTRKCLNLIERPLIVMDGSLYDYMKLSHDEALLIIKELAGECKKYGGEFMVLWHNTMLDDKAEQSFYAKMLDEVCNI